MEKNKKIEDIQDILESHQKLIEDATNLLACFITKDFAEIKMYEFLQDNYRSPDFIYDELYEFIENINNVSKEIAYLEIKEEGSHFYKFIKPTKLAKKLHPDGKINQFGDMVLLK